MVMGFGKKTDFETGRTLDLDKSYRNIIKPAVEAAGLKCVRADEIVHSGLIDVPMYEQLLNAERPFCTGLGVGALLRALIAKAKSPFEF